MKKLALVSALAVAAASPLFAGSALAATAQGTATATVIAPITLTHTSGAALAFGSFTAGTGGTVAVNSAGVGSKTGGVVLVAGSTNTADAFTVGGDASRAFTIATTGSTVTSGSNSMSFTTAASSTTGSLSSSGAASFTVGGTLTVAANQAAGSYTGSYDATVTYN
ncbi:DUF4402 domain-containing protein [Novosphingobium sp. BL-8H]|uniref:DUF4402 domain-containing protein n=1 Tax=Novosphingobium sp. BL-8H TaxID=3127640 RepID=UPI003756D6BD